MTFLLRSTVSLLCLALLTSEPLIAVDSDDEGDDVPKTRTKRARVAPVTDTAPLQREKERMTRLAEEEQRRAQKNIENIEARIQAIEEDNRSMETLLADQSDGSQASLLKALGLLVDLKRDNSGLRTTCLQRLLSIKDKTVREKIAEATASLTPKSDTEYRLLVLGALSGVPSSQLDAVIACTKKHDVYPPLAQDIAPFIQAFPKLYILKGSSDMSYDGRVRAITESADMCKRLRLTMPERTQLIRVIFTRQFNSRAAVPILALAKELFPIKYNARYKSNPEHPGGHEEKDTWTEFCQKNLVLTTTGYEWRK